MIQQIFVFWLLSPDDIPTKFYQSFDEYWTRERRLSYIESIKSYPNYLAYQLYDVRLASYGYNQ